MCLEYFIILFTADYITIRDGEVDATKLLEDCIHLDNFTKIVVPNSVHKRRLFNLDNFLKKSRDPKVKES